MMAISLTEGELAVLDDLVRALRPEGMRAAEIADVLGYSRERVAQIERAALRKIKAGVSPHNATNLPGGDDGD